MTAEHAVVEWVRLCQAALVGQTQVSHRSSQRAEREMLHSITVHNKSSRQVNDQPQLQRLPVHLILLDCLNLHTLIDV